MKHLLGLLIILASCTVHGQDNDCFSVEIDGNYLQHSVSSNSTDLFNYGVSLLLSEKVAKIKFSTGINYATKYYYYDAVPSAYSGFEVRKEHRFQYINVPFLFTFGGNANDKMRIHFVGGVIYNRLIAYNLLTSYSNKPLVNERISVKSQNPGFSLRLGVALSKRFHKNIVLNASPFCDFKFIRNYSEQSSPLQTIPDTMFSFGMKIGFEYIFRCI